MGEGTQLKTKQHNNTDTYLNTNKHWQRKKLGDTRKGKQEITMRMAIDEASSEDLKGKALISSASPQPITIFRSKWPTVPKAAIPSKQSIPGSQLCLSCSRVPSKPPLQAAHEAATDLPRLGLH